MRTLDDINIDLRSAIENLIQDILSNEIIIFCGAGISRNSGLPIVNQLIPYFLDKLKIEVADLRLILDKDNNSKIPFESFFESIQDNSRPDILFDIYGQGTPNTNHLLIASLLKLGKIKTVITTNFDKLIEKALLLGAHPYLENKDYDLIYNEQDLYSIDWKIEKIRIIKLHGSIDDKNSMAITLKQVANKNLSISSSKVINYAFKEGPHSSILILGYSSSDYFDITPQIQAIESSEKKIYYIQHSKTSSIQNITDQNLKNPFIKFNNGLRILYNTNDIIKKIWEIEQLKLSAYESIQSEINWKGYVDKWCKEHSISNSIYNRIVADLLKKSGYNKNALKYYKKAIANQNQYKNELEPFKVHRKIGLCYKNLGDYKNAIIHYDIALKGTSSIDNINEEIKILSNLGSVYSLQGNNTKGLKIHFQALKLAKKAGLKEEQARCLGSIGQIYNRLCDFDKSLEYNKKALRVSKEIGHKNFEMSIIFNVGIVYHTLNKFKNAENHFKNAYQLSIDLGDVFSESKIMGAIGAIYKDKKDYNKAIEYYESSLNKSIIIGSKTGESSQLNNLGSVFLGL